MRKLIAAINMTIDGYCDHTDIDPDEEIHDHYSNLLENADAILYGRITYQLMQYWQTVLERPSDEESMNDFARAIDKVPKIVFSNTLNDTGWNSATLSNQSFEEKVLELQQGSGKNIYVGSSSLIIQLLNANLLDELQLCVHPVVAGGGLPFFENTNHRTALKLSRTKSFTGGAVILYYEPVKK